MSLHSYSRMWVHLVWATIERRRLLDKPAAAKLSAHLQGYAEQKGIYMKINFVNPDHVHTLIDLPTNLCIEDAVHLLKGESSHWINEQNLVPGKFGWQRGYGAFSVSQSGVSEVCAYIADQEKHHAQVDFIAELKLLVTKYGLVWREEGETVKTVSPTSQPADTRLKPRANETGQEGGHSGRGRPSTSRLLSTSRQRSQTT